MRRLFSFQRSNQRLRSTNGGVTALKTGCWQRKHTRHMAVDSEQALAYFVGRDRMIRSLDFPTGLKEQERSQC
jgi:hypothetical protein